MSFRSSLFRSYFDKYGAMPNTVNTYCYYLNSIDRALNGLDEAILEKGSDALMKWSRETSQAPFETTPYPARAALKRYLQFNIESQGAEFSSAEEFVEEQAPEEIRGVIFRLEREMQGAVRKQLDRLESGLVEIDGGSEYVVGTGRIDVLAKDAQGRHVVIELKAGSCPVGALEQALGYAQSLSEEKEDAKSVRVIIIAADFSDRIRAAVKRIADVELRRYEFSLQFMDVN